MLPSHPAQRRARAVFQALESGDHVVAPNDCYHGTAALLRDVFARWGLQITFTDVTDSEQVQQAMQPNHAPHLG